MRQLYLITLLWCSLSTYCFGQTHIDSLFKLADEHVESKRYEVAKDIYLEVKQDVKKGSQDYQYAAEQLAMIYFLGKDQLREAGQYQASIDYLLTFIQYIKKEKGNIRSLWLKEKYYFLIRTIIQNYFSLNQLNEAKKYQAILYKAYRKKQLPKGIDRYYSFDNFKWKDKNVWAYEWYPELGSPESEGSFSKIVYYVYSTDEAGKDKEQLYRLHVLKVHKIDNTMPDYVLTKRLEASIHEFSGTLWAYTYNTPIDYNKLKKDVIEVLKGNYK
ncbi:MAG: hypothetical protein ACPGJS_16165 [Flammeovirgaceae bacterium]